MAGMPPSLIERANDILKQLEEKHVDELSLGNQKETNTNASPNHKQLGQNIKKITTPKVQLSIFDTHSQTFEDIRKMLTDMDINRLTPVEALMKLNEIKGMLK